MVGPEGDLAATEKTELKRAQFTFCALTPTVLRAVDAIRIGAGMLRSLL
jgi:16S rRNA U1498 N3-methylase RsmE